MSHPIVEGSVTVLKIVTPGTYWIKCRACDDASRTPTSIKHKPGLDEYFYPQQGAKVFVRDVDGFFYRGTVCGRRTHPGWREWNYVVQLTDTFQVKDFHQHDVYPTYGHSSAACSSAHMVSLYQMLACVPPKHYDTVDSTERRVFEKSMSDWATLVSDAFAAQVSHAKFSFEQPRFINESIYGKLSTSTPLCTQTQLLCNLSEYLLFEKLAEKVVIRFEAIVEALMTNPLIDFNELLPTFDPLGPAFVPKLNAPRPPEPSYYDFLGFVVHEEDVDLHMSLISSQHHINLIFTSPPLQQDAVVRFRSPDGNIVLGTVLNVDVGYIEKLEDSYVDAYNYNSRGRQLLNVIDSIVSDQAIQSETFYPDELFQNLPAPYLTNPSEKSLLSYDFNKTLCGFQADGGFFKELLFPYPNSSTVEKAIADNLALMGVDNLHPWQKLCMPTLSSRKNLVVFGHKSTGKLTTATISALCWMNYVNFANSDNAHPQLIIYISDFTRANKMANLCESLTDFRVIVSTSYRISETQKELASKGCDVLITTPSNWAKLVDEKIFDYSRLNHVIFDGFERLYAMFADDVAKIFTALPLSNSHRVQAVLVSNTFGSIMSDEKIRKKIFEFPTVCIVDAVLSCIYFAMTPKAVFVGDDSTRRLNNLLRSKPARRVLMCKDEQEGQSLISKISSFVLFAHENLSQDAAFGLVDEWSRNCNNLLVCTDKCFERLDFLKDASVLISWMTSSWAALSKRFSVFAPLSPEKLSHSSAYLFCDSANLEQLLLIEHISDNVCFFNGNLVDHLDRAYYQAEHSKISAICPSVFMFGKCNDVPSCPLRHIFVPNDRLEVMNDNQFLNVDILKVHNAFKYSVRVREVLSNSGVSKSTESLISKLKEIEGGLATCCQKRCESVNLGQIVGCITSGQLRRATVQSIPDGASDLYTLSFVDFEAPHVQLPLSHLFALPKELAEHPKDVVDLYLAGLAPADLKSDWQNDTFNFVTNTLTRIIKSSNLLAGKVEVTGNRSVLVDSLHCFREHEPGVKVTLSVVSSEFFSLKQLMLVGGCCVENSAHLQLLSDLYISSGISLNPDRKQCRRENLPSHRVPAIISSFDDPGLFYVQLTEETDELANFEKALSSVLDKTKKQLGLIAVDQICATWANGVWNRALIFDIVADIVDDVGPIHILFVDHGDTLLDVRPIDLFCLPPEFATTPFFAMQCELVGIKRIRPDSWHEKTLEEFRSYIRTERNEMKDLLVEFRGCKITEDFSSYPGKYQVVLVDPNNQKQSINLQLALRGFVAFDPETEHLLDKPSKSDVRK